MIYDKNIYTKKTIQQANDFIAALPKGKQMSIDFDGLCIAIHKARRLHKIYENECNRELKKNEIEERDLLETKINRFFLSSGCQIKFNGDPRGFPVKIHHPSKIYNTNGGREEGWGIG